MQFSAIHRNNNNNNKRGQIWIHVSANDVTMYSFKCMCNKHLFRIVTRRYVRRHITVYYYNVRWEVKTRKPLNALSVFQLQSDRYVETKLFLILYGLLLLFICILFFVFWGRVISPGNSFCHQALFLSVARIVPNPSVIAVVIVTTLSVGFSIADVHNLRLLVVPMLGRRGPSA